MRLSSALLVLAPTLFLAGAQAQATPSGLTIQIDCPSADLSTYLLAVIDACYAQGLTYYEQFLAAVSGTDDGYALLANTIYYDKTTLFAPTDAAFRSAGLYPPFTNLSDSTLVQLFELHTTSGTHDYASLPASPANAIATTELSLKAALGTNSSSTAQQVLTLQQGQNNQVTIKAGDRDVNSWGPPGVNFANTIVTNLVILPIDQVIPSPPNLIDALKMDSSPESSHGLPQFSAAISNVSSSGLWDLAQLTNNGFTIFAPVDAAFTPAVLSELAASSSSILANHYKTDYTLYSPEWASQGSFNFTMVSGETLVIASSGGQTTVSLGGQTVNVIRSDITLDNGVMHLIDGVLAYAGTSGASASTGTLQLGNNTGVSSSSGSTGGRTSTSSTNSTSNPLAGLLGAASPSSAFSTSSVALFAAGALALGSML